jgi:hypothetical protein
VRAAWGARTPLIAANDLLYAADGYARSLSDLTSAEAHLGCLKDGSIALKPGPGEFSFGQRVLSANRSKLVEHHRAEAARGLGRR